MISKENIKRLNKDFQSRLLNQSETGMGYQILDNTQNRKDIKLILNSELTINFENTFDPIDFIWQYQGERARHLFFQFPTYQPINIDFGKIEAEELESDTLQSDSQVATNLLYTMNISVMTYPPFTYLTRRGDEFYRPKRQESSYKWQPCTRNLWHYYQ